jgi:hypothetical protein
MADSNYFACGELFLQTRHKVNADFVFYGPDLTSEQIHILRHHDIVYNKVNPRIWETQMQFLKFDLFLREMNLSFDRLVKYDGFTLVDFDTFFINDWSHVFNYDFDFAVTVREGMKKCYRAYANGGVTFAKLSGKGLLEYAQRLILKGVDDALPEYDTIWKTLENGRATHKTHYRTELRWWVDQVFFSALILKHGYVPVGIEPLIFKFNEYNIGMFSCNHYNVLDSDPIITKESDIYIRHMKSAGRIKAVGKDPTQEKIR